MLRTERRRSIVRTFSIILAALALSGLAAAAGATNAASRLGPNAAKFAGAFVNWGSVGREHTLQAWAEAAANLRARHRLLWPGDLGGFS